MLKKSIGLTALSMLLAASGFAGAPESGDEAAFDMPEVVVTATKTEMGVKQVPAAVQVITKEDIEQRGAQILKDIIGSATGVGIMRSNGREALSIRGFDSRYCRILINGERVPAEPDANYELDRISLEDVERIEIVRGPLSSLYGADALGGVVNIITRRAAGTRGFSLQGDYGAFTQGGEGKGRYAAEYHSGRQGKISMALSGSHFENDKLLKNSGTTYLPFGRRNNIKSRFEYFPEEGKKVTLTASQMNENTHEYSTMQSLFGPLQTDVHDDNRRTAYSLSYENTLADGGVYVNAYHTIWDKYNDTYNRALSSSVPMNSVYGYYTVTGLEGRVHKKVADDHVLTVGGEYRPELFRGTGIQTGKGTFTKVYHGKSYTGSEITTHYSALYAQDEWLAAPKLLVITSARYDGSDQFEDKVSPKLGLTYTPEPGWRLKLNAGRGFKVPSPNQLYLNLNVVRNGSLVNLTGNTALRPETSTTYDISVERDMGRASGKLTYFTSQIRDMIDEVWVSSAQIQYQNINKAALQGLEAEITYPVSGKFTWSGNYLYLDATNDTAGSRLFNRARHKLSSSFTYRPSETWRASLWTDSYLDYWYQQNSGAGKAATYTVCNLALEKRLTGEQTLLLGIDNLLNRKNDDLSISGTFVHMGYKIKL